MQVNLISHTFRSHRHHRLSFQIRYLSFRFGSLIKRGYQKANTIRIIIIRFLVIIAQSKHCIWTDHQWQTVIIMRLFLPFSSTHLCSGDQIIPGSLRQIILHFTVLFKDRSHQQRIAEHILPIQGITCTILREIQEHRAQHRTAFFV